MNPLTPGPPPPIPGHHQNYHQNYYQPPLPAAPPVHHGQPNATQPCFNCGATTHWAQQCPEPRRHMPAGTAQQKSRNRGSKSGPGPIITRYPPPQPQFYSNHPYPATPQAHTPGGAHYQQPYQPYGAPPPPPPPPPAPPPHPMPPQQGPGQHYGVPQAPTPYPHYSGPVNTQYSHAPPYSPAGYTAGPPPPPPVTPLHHHQQIPFYSLPSQNGPPQAFRTPVAPPAPYQFYNQPPTPQPFPMPPQRKGNNQGRHRQHTTSQPQLPAQQRNSVSESSSASTKGIGPIIWRPPLRVETPLATTLQETEEAEERGLTGFENPNGTISKYWNPGGKRTKAHPRLSELMSSNDPALLSIRGGCRVIERDFLEAEDNQDAGRDDVAMELENSDDGKPDELDKLSGVLSRQSPDHGGDFRSPSDGEYTRRRSLKYEERRSSRDEDRKAFLDGGRRTSRDVGAQSPHRDRSMSPSNEGSIYSSSYRSRTPSGGACVRKNRTQHSLPQKPDGAIDASMKSLPKPTEKSTLSCFDYSPIKIKEEPRSRSRSASPTRRDSEDGNRRHRDYDVKREDSEKGKVSKDSKKRRTSGTNGVPAVFGRRW
ncbi:hypothetical protein EV426DRAFT_672085 [Tirmania nivea]|nr:hypothetical protein EV426DRAFT_672085 [Tirmania nivea]